MNKQDYLALCSIKGIGIKKLVAILKRYDSLQAFIDDPSKLALSDKQTIALLSAAKQIDWHKIELHLSWQAASPNHHIITWLDACYPQTLLNIEAPPPILFAIGNAGALKLPALAIVGSRLASKEGLQRTFKFSQQLAEQGFCIVSGLAKGIDGQAHQGALAAGGQTIAVMGTGIDKIYPYQHKKLAKNISQTGLLLSELPLGHGPMAHHFPMRNRIIAGLSLGIIVAEASIKSGSLITARLGLEQGKDIFAFPGSPSTNNARGCHHLIKQGAKLVEYIDDIVEELPASALESLEEFKPLPAQKLASGSQNLVKCISYQLTTVESLLDSHQLSVPSLASQLVELELAGLVKSVPGGYIRV